MLLELLWIDELVASFRVLTEELSEHVIESFCIFVRREPEKPLESV